MVNSGDPLAKLGALFADHARNPGEVTALRLADALDENGEDVRADLLRRCAHHGGHTVEANWWELGARCHLGIDLPTPTQIGQLWFDPLEISLSLILPRLEPTEPTTHADPNDAWFEWISLSPVTEWQLMGAHLLKSEIPSSPSDVAGENTYQYCRLFGKVATSDVAWLCAKDAYGLGGVRRLWGESAAEYGSDFGISGFIEIHTWNSIESAKASDVGMPNMADEMEPEGYAFRTSASCQLGLYSGPGVLARAWTR